MKNKTRIDIFPDMEAVHKFYEWAKQFNPKTKDDMTELLAKYKKADMIVDEFKEHVEHKITEGMKAKERKNG
jgi:hypothetical protein